jgi:hypothetical protein
MRNLAFSQAQRPNFSSSLGEITDHIDAAADGVRLARHHARFFADMALGASDSVRTLQLDIAAFGDVMVLLTARLEDVIEALAQAQATAAVMGKDAQESKR